MKNYWSIVIGLFLIWLIVSTLFPEPIWWSVFSSNRATHTPLSEQLSLNKIALFLMASFMVMWLLRKVKR